MRKVVLSVKNLSKLYKDRAAVSSLNFSVYEGEIVGFIGANGAGKSTTIKLITGLIKPSSGEIKICGQDIQNREKALSQIGAIVEAPHFYEYMSAQANLEYFASYFPSVDKNRIEEVLKLIGLESRKDDKVAKFSMGMKQRLGIGQALLNNPKLLILDEPTNGLDAQGIVQMRQFLKDITKKTNVAIFISSHILSELENLCDRFIIIDNGYIKDTFTRQEMKGNQKDEKNYNSYIEADNIEIVKNLLKIKFNISGKVKGNKIYFHADKVLRSKIISTLAKSNINLTSFGNVKVALEQKFLHSIK